MMRRPKSTSFGYAITLCVYHCALGGVLDCPNPVSAWTRSYGGNHGSLSVEDMAVDGEGNVLLCGWFRGAVDFDPTEGLDARSSTLDGASTPRSTSDIFISKLRPDGTYAWTYAIGGPATDQANGLTIDRLGNLYVTGQFEETVDFDAGATIDSHDSVGNRNFFVTKLRTDGSYAWTISFDGPGSAVGQRIGVDTNGALFIVGYWGIVFDFDPFDSEDIHQANGGFSDVFVTKLHGDGTYAWTRTFGGPSHDQAANLAIDSLGNVFLTGTFRGLADFDPGPGTDFHQGVRPPFNEDLFVTKLLADGSYGWTRTYSVRAGGLALDSGGNVLIAGGFSQTVDFDPTSGIDLRTAVVGSPGPIPGENLLDVFATCLTTDGAYRWTTALGGPGGEAANAVTTDNQGNIFMTGSFQKSVDFDPGKKELQLTAHGGSDGFVMALDPQRKLNWARRFGGSGSGDHGDSVLVGPMGSLYINGILRSPADMNFSCPTDIHGSKNGNDDIVMKLYCVVPTADADRDGAVDLNDFASFQTCFTGAVSEFGESAVCEANCPDFDFSQDDSIELADFFAFAQLFTGPR